ncbi:unnamed protein product [Dimorphilus gyrociliatus]|uniref:Uncharacterized protein n=1 Tax=Dimorphilus gyrociliatus TaxID=2664684 RepID=A0A7I8VS50_9ANNE|nr:unnamed protein product [Dimorphilus gyrociliatus]
MRRSARGGSRGKKSDGKGSRPTTSQSEREELQDESGNIAWRCAIEGKAERLNRCFENSEDPYHEKIEEMMGLRDDDEGKTPLDIASILGRDKVVGEIIYRNFDVNCKMEKSFYTSLHLAAAWGSIKCVKQLVEAGADLHHKNSAGERAREIALRYSQTECVDYLDWAEAKQDLLLCIERMRATLGDNEKVQGKLTRDDKNIANGACNEKQVWVDGSPNATTKDYIAMKHDLDEILTPIWEKINNPSKEFLFLH